MKRRILIGMLSIFVTACTLFTACGKLGKSGNYYDTALPEKNYVSSDGVSLVKSETANYKQSAGLANGSYSDDYNYSEGYNDKSDINESAVLDSDADFSRKIIKNAGVEVQTLDFDNFIASLESKVALCGGYIENAYTSGNNIYYSSSRRATYTVRVPQQKLDEMLNMVNEIGTVTSTSYSAEDITLTYVDVEARIKTLETEQKRLLELLSEAYSVSDIIVIEQRLSDVNYQLESYNSRLRSYDSKINYSTLNVSVVEVEKIVPVQPEKKTVWQRIAIGFTDNISDICICIQNIFVYICSYIVNILFWIAVIVAVIIFFKKKFGKRGKKRYQKNDINNAEHKETNK